MENCYLVINKTEGVIGGVVGVFKTRALANEQVEALKKGISEPWPETKLELVIEKRIIFG